MVNEDLEQMKKALLALTESSERREEMSAGAIDRIQSYTIENMAAEHNRIFTQKGNRS